MARKLWIGTNVIKPKKNPVTKIIGAGVKAAAKAAGKKVKPSLKAAQKAKPLANPKSAVKVKGAAKPKPNKPDLAKLNYKKGSTIGRAEETAYRQNMKDQSKPNYSGYGAGSHGDASIEAMIAGKEAVLGRKTRIGIQKSMGIKPTKRPKKSK